METIHQLFKDNQIAVQLSNTTTDDCRFTRHVKIN